ncbi:hypothetical protein NW768_006415 [Fusarium equiseti]|uniref:Uncharacterized protein n=1 Tax=Fusarium equiseti TaxID=61235 RepID=A0ABQ8RBE7_FUSEQ|nr:hypothetical protein NW768_006415 [Fusarium equiseti]
MNNNSQNDNPENDNPKNNEKEDDDEDDGNDENIDAECDFSVYLERYLEKNKGAWNNHPPDVNSWPLIRYTGNIKKKWPQRMAVQAALYTFDAADSLGTDLLDETIEFIKEHYISQKGKKDSRSYENESSLIVPSHAQILACQFVAKNGQINSWIATYLAAMSLAHLQQVSTVSTGNGNKDGEAHSLALSAVNTAATALKAAEANEEMFKKKTDKPFKALTTLGHYVIAMDVKFDTLKEQLGKQPAELKKELKRELKAELKKEVREELKKERSDLKGKLSKYFAELKKTQLGKGQVTGSGSAPLPPTSTPSKRGPISSVSGPAKKSKLDLSDFDFTKQGVNYEGLDRLE